MPTQSWKRYELRLCRDMGVERQACTGERDGADNQPHPRFMFQFKLRRMIPAWVTAWLLPIAGKAERAGKIGVLVVKRPRARDDESVVLVRWKDWCALHPAQREKIGKA